MGAMNPFNEQNFFRIRDDSTAADPGTPNWISTENQSTAVVIDADTNFRIRFVVSNSGTANSTSDFGLYVNKNSTSYAAVTASSSNVQAADASSSADATALTTSNFQLTAGTGTAANGEYSEDGVAGANLSNGDYFEVEFGVTIISGDVADGDTLDFRVYYGGSAMDQYDTNATPRVEVNELTVNAGAGSAAGTSTATAVGERDAATDGSAAATSTATAVGESDAASVGSAAATSTATAVGSGIAAAAGSSAGTSTATGVGDSITVNSGAGTAAATSTAVAVGASDAEAPGTAAATSAATGVGESTTAAAGSSTAAGAATGVGESTAASVGSSAGAGAASAVGDTVGGVNSGVGTAAGAGTATGVGASTAEAVGSAAATATAVAVGESVGGAAQNNAGGWLPPEYVKRISKHIAAAEERKAAQARQERERSERVESLLHDAYDELHGIAPEIRPREVKPAPKTPDVTAGQIAALRQTAAALERVNIDKQRLEIARLQLRIRQEIDALAAEAAWQADVERVRREIEIDEDNAILLMALAA